MKDHLTTTAILGLYFCVLPAAIFAGEPFVRGDVDANGVIEITDALRIFQFRFLGDPGRLGCEDRADADDNGEIELTDSIAILGFLFLGDRPLPRPGLVCAHAPGQGIFCDIHRAFQPGYDPTPHDPFTCGDTLTVGLEAGRPVEVHIPPSYDPEVALPLVLFLHGGLSFHCSVVDSNNIDMGAWTEASRDFRGLANERGFLYAHPNAPIYPFGAGDSCAIIWNGARPRFSTEDDSAYLRGVIEEIQGKLTVDPGRVFMIGRSNGGSMVHRMACDHPDLLAAVVSIAGATYMDPGDCAPSAPVHVLQIHGTDDRTVFYRGDKTYPGAVATVEQWAMHNDCVVEPEELPPLDLEIHIDQADGNPAETVVTRYAAQCNAGGSAELWTIPGGTHVPGLIDPWVEPFPRRRPNPAFSEAVIDWLFGHSKPLEASFTVTPERGLRPLEVTVDASAFAATLQGSASYEWDFGDGTTDEGAQVEHTYTNVGRFPIQLTVTDSEGRMFRATGRVNVRLASEPVDPWEAGDIGAVTAHGGVGFEESCLRVLGAEGKGLGQREDDFHYVYQRAAGNFRLKARLTGWNGAGRESRVGLMVRESLEPNAYHASVSLRDSGEGLRHEFLRRSSNFTRTFAHETYDSADLWLELEREGDAVRGRLSTDGENWTEADDAVFEGFPDEVFVGVAAAASENDFGIASFCDVQLVEG